MTIVYTSETGFTAEYANKLGKLLDIPVYTLTDALEGLEHGREIFYMAWVMAGRLKDYDKAKKKFKVQGICGVGIRPDTENMLKSLSKTHSISKDCVFYLQGGYKPDVLKGSYKAPLTVVLSILKGKIKSQASISQEEQKLLEVFSKGGSFVEKENLSSMELWLKNKV